MFTNVNIKKSPQVNSQIWSFRKQYQVNSFKCKIVKSFVEHLPKSILHYRAKFCRTGLFCYFSGNNDNWFSRDGCWIHFWLDLCFIWKDLETFLFYLKRSWSFFVLLEFCYWWGNLARWSEVVFIINRNKWKLELLKFILKNNH